ncbi:MAG: hypothetical protein IPG56_20640 [Caulobacteraceae bacterium]|nr:hypothetical protein [Caulobacteraceae bacterium]
MTSIAAAAFSRTWASALALARPRVKIEGGAGSASDTVFAYQGLAGIGFAMNDRTTFDLGYRYFMAPDVDISEPGAPASTPKSTTNTKL